jgi:hypothetical protein
LKKNLRQQRGDNHHIDANEAEIMVNDRFVNAVRSIFCPPFDWSLEYATSVLVDFIKFTKLLELQRFRALYGRVRIYRGGVCKHREESHRQLNEKPNTCVISETSSICFHIFSIPVAIITADHILDGSSRNRIPEQPIH